MKRSLQRHLSMVLGSAILIAGLIAAVASFSLAYLDAKEFQDDLLRQIARISAGRTTGSPPATVQQPDTGNDGITDPESLISIFHLPGDKVPAWVDPALSAGLHTLNTGSGELRVFVSEGKPGMRTIVAQPTEVRDEIAINSALRTLIPLLLLLPVLLWLIVRIVRSELAPVKLLSRNLDEQSAERLQPVADEDLPSEIAPFVHSINRLLARVNHLMSQQRRFIADAAHELRSPLTALSLQAQNLKHADSLAAVQERVIPLQEGIERARQLTEQLLSMARTQSAAGAETEIDVAALARELIAEFLPLAEAKRIDLGIEEIAPVSLHAEPEALRLILRNALENAIKYTHAGGEVTLRLCTEKDSANIEIADNGPGIPAAERERVFDTFYRVPGSAGEGSGLGLAIAREAAIRCGGILSLHERPQGGGLVLRYRQPRKNPPV